MNITFKNFDRVANTMRYMAAKQPEITDPVMADWVKDMRYALKAEPYPPKRPGQRYVRTGRLANSWAAEQVKPGVWRIVNNARSPITNELYAARVVGDAKGQGQGPYFINRWWKAIDILNGFTGDLTERLSKALVRYWEQHG